MAPATVLNWFLMADETHGPAIKITKTIIAMIRTYSTVDCPFGRRVNLGDTPPPERNFRCVHVRLLSDWIG
ncbi:hypothetical protein COLAER_02097 [Collinsella aerofaciens ATCC 25986]|uniref:Uncharacterized protein n=1 Tax=Collinsella aerofaciens (strain ATCC 25986 / DSM 3979 / JCM 10188 / KCTC 3647 / NCTC 11838 / VPI 1003) TaxID=411903 RepID=A4ECB7_COLAA|nr:hypothetical protein COLAER_02097 [Collinsella aerofaciens ATCC 25986]